MTDLEFGTTKALATTGNLRLVTERFRPMPDGYPALATVCTEPSPDYAIAFGQKADGNVKVTLPQGSGEGGLKVETTEQATPLAGRTAGVLALRDGLYAACQAYANGTIGHDAYAIILSQYGTLLVALTSSGTAGVASRDDAGRRATLSALLVSCISEFDRTRLAPPQNPLLDLRFCRNVLSRSLAHGTSRS
ncbi:hypothetical protein [Methylobacterium sp. J-090]|uniref:hypothetical protein n=1 Tax=Methylobacterium sp. J-090 TaxID=2836666 RepID=UPI001FBB6307|nr:hypothetical protein [Methylobacterium sp. J-090]MCJ2082976.1 hypothetical protein [Methylobacterium sp. J-090]